MIPRALAAVAALGCAALLVVWLGAFRAEERANEVANGRPALVRGQTLATALADARSARRLAPDVPAKLIEWQLLFASGQREGGERLLREMARDEPSNFGVWFLIASVAEDPRLAREARRRERELNPLVARRR